MSSVILFKVAQHVVPTVLATLIMYWAQKAGNARRNSPQAPPGMSLQEMIKRARDRLGMDVINLLNFAFCGPQGSGKSTLINCLRGLNDVVPSTDQWGPAPTGEIETTQTTKCYRYPEGCELDFVCFWDHPGCGTQTHSSTDYFEKNVLYAYDCVLMVTTGGLGEYEKAIIEAANRCNTAIVIVVNKAEQRFESKVEREAVVTGPLDAYTRRRMIQKTIAEAKANICEELRKIRQGPVPTFVVSAKKFRRYLITQDPVDMELAMEIDPLMNHLIDAACSRRPQQ